MSSPKKMRALIERAEQASGPDRELDAEISVAAGRYETHVERRSDGTTKLLPWRGDGTGSYNIECRRYTASLDAAASLVPSGWVWLRKTPQTMTVYMPPQDEKAWAVHIDGAAATPALALTAAALRARLAEMEKRDAE